MKLKITYREKNPEYSQAYADEYKNGEESVDNMKDLYSKRFEVDADIDEISFSNNGERHLVGTLENGKKSNMTLPNMATLSCLKDSKIIAQYSVSKNLLLKTHQVHNEKYNITRFYFYLKPYENYTFPTDRICMLYDEVPEEFFEYN